ncbi:MAG: hypothetical protein ACYTG1_09170, partial [Planctomycetota bacterium]
MPAQRPASMPAGLVFVRPSGPQEWCSGAGILPALPSFQSTSASPASCRLRLSADEIRKQI